MSAPDPRSVLARKIAAHAGVGLRPDSLPPKLEAGLTRAVRRAGAPLEGFNIEVQGVSIGLDADLDAAIDALPATGLVAATEDQEGRRGLLALEHSLIDALIEVQTTGRVEEGQGPARPVTRIDEALCRDFIDLLFAAFAHETGALSGRDWPDRVAYGSQIKDRSQINLLLPARGYHLFEVTISAAGLKTGKLVWLMPTDPGLARQIGKKANAKPPRPETWAKDMLAALGPAQLALDAILVRVHLPLSKVEALGDGDLIPFDASDLAKVSLEGEGGHVFGRGKLGQINGRRALRFGDGSGKAARSAPPAMAKAAEPAPLAPSPPPPEPAPGALPDLPMAAGLTDPTPVGDISAEMPGTDVPEMPMAAFDPDAPIG